MSDLGNKEIFAQNLKYYMELNRKDRYEICNILGFKYSTFSEWCNANKYPRIDKIEMLANYFNISKSDLIEDKQKDNINELGNPVVSIPLLGSVKAGYNHLAQETWQGTIKVDSSIITANRNEYFALEVKGDSMSPFFMEGDTVIIHKQNDCENNEYVVVIINGDEGTLKMLKKTNFGIILQPLNPSYEPVAYTNEEIEVIPIQIAGIVVKSERIFKK